MATKSVVADVQEIKVAIEMIQLGARLPVIESLVSLSKEKLLRLYKEIKGVSPAKGMFPSSPDWFVTWQPNIHSSLFYNIYSYLVKHSEVRGREALIKAYGLYLEQITVNEGEEPIFSFTRAWTLIKFIESGMLTMVPCIKCKGKFVYHNYELTKDFVCGLCQMPSRAGKTKKAKN